MEEQKNSKEVKMEVVNNGQSEENAQKLTYEQLNNACVQLSQQNQYMKQQLQQAQRIISTFNRLDYLFKVVEVSANASSKWHFTDDFMTGCISEIEEIMTPSEEAKEDKGN